MSRASRRVQHRAAVGSRLHRPDAFVAQAEREVARGDARDDADVLRLRVSSGSVERGRRDCYFIFFRASGRVGRGIWRGGTGRAPQRRVVELHRALLDLLLLDLLPHRRLGVLVDLVVGGLGQQRLDEDELVARCELRQPGPRAILALVRERRLVAAAETLEKLEYRASCG